jgi:hypothetical protein
MIGLVYSINRDDPEQEIFLSSEKSIPALESTQSSEVHLNGYPGIKQPGYEADSGPNEYQG